MDSVYSRQVHSYSTMFAVDLDDHEPLPDDDVDIPVHLQLAEDDDPFAGKQDDKWHDLGLSAFTATLPPPPGAHHSRHNPDKK